MKGFFIFLALATAFFVGVQTADAGTVNVDVFYSRSNDGDGAPFSGLVGSFTSPDIMFATNTGYNWHPFGLGSFGAQIKGILSVAGSDNYWFSLSSDDGSALYIDGGLVVYNGGGHGPTMVTGGAPLSAGLHSFTVNFWEDFGGPSGVDLYLPNGVTYGSAVPLPAGILLLGPGLVGLAALRRRIGK